MNPEEWLSQYPQPAPSIYSIGTIGRKECLAALSPEVLIDGLGIPYIHKNPKTGDIACGRYGKDGGRLETRDLIMTFEGFCVLIKGAADNLFDVEREDGGEDHPARRRAHRRPNGPPCECECGGYPKSGRFMPGHDAKLKASLRKAMASGGKKGREAEEEMLKRGWLK